jgi:pyruvate dehydrogenase E1 component beta subunit
MAVMSYREALHQTLQEEMERDERIFLIGEDIGAFGGSYSVTKGFLEQFGEKRVRDAPLAESIIIGLSIGAAMGGLRPVPELMTINFSLLAMDQIVNHAAKLRHMFAGKITVPMTIRTAMGTGQLSGTHSQFLEVLYAHFPGLKVVTPAFPADARGMLKTALRGMDPVMFIEHTGIYGLRGEVPDGDYTTPFESALVREGRDLTVVTYSRMVHVALHAAEELAKDGIELEIVDLRSLRPLDIDKAVASVQKTNRALVLEEDWKSYGIGAEITARLQEAAFDYLDAPVRRIAQLEAPIPYARNLEQAMLPTADDVVTAAREIVSSHQSPVASRR